MSEDEIKAKLSITCEVENGSDDQPRAFVIKLWWDGDIIGDCELDLDSA